MLPAPSWSIHLTDRGCSCCWRGWFTIIEIWMGWDTHEDLRNYRWSWEIHFDRVCLNEFDRTWFKVICFGFKNKGYKKTMHLENCHASSVFFAARLYFMFPSINQRPWMCFPSFPRWKKTDGFLKRRCLEVEERPCTRKSTRTLDNVP